MIINSICVVACTDRGEIKVAITLTITLNLVISLLISMALCYEYTAAWNVAHEINIPLWYPSIQVQLVS